MALDIAFSWAMSPALEPALTDVMVTELVKKRNWRALRRVASHDILTREHLSSLDLTLDEAVLVLGRGPEQDVLGGLALERIQASTPKEAEEALLSWNHYETDAIRALVERLGITGKRRVLKNARTNVLEALDLASLAPVFKAPRKLPQDLALVLSRGTSESCGFLLGLDLVSFLNASEALGWRSHCLEVLAQRFARGDFRGLEEATTTRVVEVLSSTLCSWEEFDLRPGSRFLEVLDASTKELERFSGPGTEAARDAFLQARAAYLRDACAPGEWAHEELPTRARLLDEVLSGGLTTLAVAHVRRTLDEELLRACLSSKRTPATEVATLLEEDVLELALAGRTKAWRKRLIKASCSSGRSRLGILALHLGLDEVLEVLAPKGDLDPGAGEALFEAFLDEADPSSADRVLSLVRVADLEDSDLEDHLAPYLSRALGPDPRRWEVVLALLPDFTGTLAELSAACTELV